MGADGSHVHTCTLVGPMLDWSGRCHTLHSGIVGPLVGVDLNPAAGAGGVDRR
jgi:hypothetical protein